MKDAKQIGSKVKLNDMSDAGVGATGTIIGRTPTGAFRVRMDAGNLLTVQPHWCDVIANPTMRYGAVIKFVAGVDIGAAQRAIMKLEQDGIIDPSGYGRYETIANPNSPTGRDSRWVKADTTPIHTYKSGRGRAGVVHPMTSLRTWGLRLYRVHIWIVNTGDGFKRGGAPTLTIEATAARTKAQAISRAIADTKRSVPDGYSVEAEAEEVSERD